MRVIRPPPGDLLQLSLDKDEAQGYAQQTGPGPLTSRRRDRRPVRVPRLWLHCLTRGRLAPQRPHLVFIFDRSATESIETLLFLKNALNYVRLGRLNLCVVYMKTNSKIRIET